MKKVLAISILAAMLLCVSIAAMADATNWQLIIKATDLQGMNSGGNLTIACQSTFTDGIDSTKGEPTNPASPLPNTTIAVAAALLPGDIPTVRDFKAPIVAPAEKDWTIKIYQAINGTGADLGTMKVTVSLSTSTTLKPVYNFGGTDYEFVFSGAYAAVYNAANPIPATFSFNVGTASASIVNLAVRPVGGTVITPEPSSMVALASGLFGLVGFGIRRRK